MINVNEAPYVSKMLRKAIMKRSCLENVYFRKQDNHSLRTYKYIYIYLYIYIYIYIYIL